MVLGRIGAPFGVRGWVRVQSHTDPVENLLDYPVWHLERSGEWQPYRLHQGQQSGGGLSVQLCGPDGKLIEDRDQAAALAQSAVAVGRDELPALPPGEFYWADLIGLDVVTVDGMALGKVDSLMQTGANDVLVVRDGKRERLIPYVREQVVTQVDIPGGRLLVDWDPEF